MTPSATDRLSTVSHYLCLVVAIDADHTCLLVDIRLKLVKFNTERLGWITFQTIGSAVFFIVIVFISPIIIGSDMVAVMT